MKIILQRGATVDVSLRVYASEHDDVMSRATSVFTRRHPFEIIGRSCDGSFTPYSLYAVG